MRGRRCGGGPSMPRTSACRGCCTAGSCGARIRRRGSRGSTSSAARALPGVVAVLTHEDVPRNEMRMELPGRMAEATAGAVLAFQPVLAPDRVRFHGEAGRGHRRRDAGDRCACRRAGGDRLRGPARRLGSRDGAAAGGPARARGRQCPAALASAQGRRRPRIPPGRRGGGADLPDALRGSRLHRDRDGHRMDRRRGRAGPPGEHAGARALPRRGRRAPAAAQPGAARGRVSRRRLRRQGGRDGRVPARPARVEDAAAGCPRLLA